MRRRYAVIFIAYIVALIVLLVFIGSPRDNKKDQATASPTASPLPPVTGDLAKYYNQKITWENCDSGFECTKVKVPLDYANPSGASIELSVNRHKAVQQSKGVIFVNPGGPGGSGIEYAKAIDYIMTPELVDNFDVVGFDPRGVGASNPVKCGTDKDIDAYINADQSPDNQSEIDQYAAISKKLANGCAKTSPDIYRFVDTVSAARDVDILRDALEQSKLNWFGKSYGTFLGATYAGLFPTRVGHMMLDGAIDPTLSNEQLSYGQAIGFENALRRFVDDCAKLNDCPVKAGPAGVQQIADMLDKLDQRPGVLAGGRLFTQSLGFIGVLGDLYDKNYGWPDLRMALKDAFKGNYKALATSADFYIARDNNGHYTDNSNEAIAAVNCLDRPDRATIEQTQQLAADWSKKAPVFGVPLAWSNFGCTYWPAPATGKPETITAAGSPTILVIGTVHDPATPYPWAVALSKQLSKGVLLTYTGDGHTAYFQGSSCIDDYVDQFFLTGEAKSGVSCDPDKIDSAD